MRTHVDLCTGIGGFSLGFIAAGLSEPVLLCDFDEKVRKLLKVRFPGIPIANDVKEIASDPKRFIHERPFILSSGYPCQPFSASGKRQGEEDPRHIFPHIAEIVAQTRPSYCVFENVYGHISLGLDKVLSQMGSLDYATATFIVPAAGFRPHKRDRLWIICKNMANTSGIRGQNFSRSDKEITERSSESENVKPSNSCTSDRGAEIVANTKDSSGEQAEWERGESVGGGGVDSVWSEDKRNDLERAADVANTNSEGLQGHGQHSELERESCTKQLAKGSLQKTEFRQTMSNFCRIFDGISDWLDEPRHIQRTTNKNEHRAERLKQLGNALLPQITYRIGLAIKEIEDKNDAPPVS